MEEELLRSVEEQSLAFSRADPACLAPLANSLSKLRERALEGGGAEALAESMAVARLVNLLPLLSRHCPELYGLMKVSDSGSMPEEGSGSPAAFAQLLAQASTSDGAAAAAVGGEVGNADGSEKEQVVVSAAIRPLVNVLRVLQILLAGIPANQEAFLQMGGLDAVVTIADRITTAAVLKVSSAAAAAGGVAATAGKDNVIKGLEQSPSQSKAATPKAAATPSVQGAAATASPSQQVVAGAGSSSAASTPPQPPVPSRRSRSINRGASAGLTLPIAPSSTSPMAAASLRSPGPGSAVLGNKTPSSPATPGSYFFSMPPPSPTAASLPLHIDLPSDYLVALAKILQVVGNFCAGGPAYQRATWERCFPGNFSRVAATQSWEVLSPLCMVLFTCCRNDAKAAADVATSADGVALLASLLRAEGRKLGGGSGLPFPSPVGPKFAQEGMDEWLSLLLHALCIHALHLPAIFRNLPNHSPRPALGQIRGIFCPEQAALLWILWGCLHDDAARRGSGQPEGMPTGGASVPAPAAVEGTKARLPGTDSGSGSAPKKNVLREDAAMLEFLCSVWRNAGEASAKAGAVAGPTNGADGGGKVDEGGFTNVPAKVLQYVLQILRVLAAESSSGSSGSSQEASDLFSTVGPKEVIPLALAMLSALPPPARAAPRKEEGEAAAAALAAAEASAVAAAREKYPTVEPYHGYRRDLVAVVANACYGRPANQDAVREQGGLLLVLQQCVVDEGNPLLREWGLWAMRNLLEGNEGNQKEVAELRVVGGAETPELKGIGLRVVVDPTTGRAKLENVSSS